MPELESFIEAASALLEGLGVFVILAGFAVATVCFGASIRKQDAYDRYRRRLGRAILLGLEILVAGDIVRTVTTEPEIRSVLALALIVLIRTFLSFSIEVEIEGRWPWQARPRAQT